MESSQRLHGQILSELTRLNKPITIEHIAYKTGVTPTIVRESVQKLVELDIVRIEGDTLILNKENKFEDWNRFTK